MTPPRAPQAARTLDARDALLRSGQEVVFTRARTEVARRMAPSLAVPLGTVWLDDGTLETEAGTRRLTAARLQLVHALRDGRWHDDEELRRALARPDLSRSALHSLVARLRGALGPCIEKRYGGGWRLVAQPSDPQPQLVDLLVAGEGVPASTLCAGLGCSATALRVRVHRARKAGYDIRSHEGGYLLVDDGGVGARLTTALKRRAMVVLWGPLGVGKTWLASRHRLRLVSVDGMDAPRAIRRVRAVASSGAGGILVDGVVDPTPYASVLQELVAAGFRVLVTARHPLRDVDGVENVEMGVWSERRLRRTFPDAEGQGWDGLPLGAQPEGVRRARVLAGVHEGDGEALDAIARSGPHEAAHPVARALGWVVGHPARVARPVLEVLRSEWSDARWRAHARELGGRLERDLDERKTLPAGLDGEVRAVIREVQARGLASHELVLSAFHLEILADDAVLEHAWARCDDPAFRASLSYARWLLAPVGDDTRIRQAIDEAEGTSLAYEFRVELASARWREDEVEARALFDEVERWLSEQPPEAHLWIRCECLASLALCAPREVDPARLLDLYLDTERTRFLEHAPKASWSLLQLRWALGVTLIVRDRLDEACRALEPNVSADAEETARRGGLDLLVAYVRLGRGTDASRLWGALSKAELPPAWDARRRAIRGLQAMVEGTLDEVREALGEAPMDPTSATVRGLLVALRGEDSAIGDRLDVNVQVARVMRGEASPDTLEGLPPCRMVSGSVVRRIVERWRGPGGPADGRSLVENAARSEITAARAPCS